VWIGRNVDDRQLRVRRRACIIRSAAVPRDSEQSTTTTTAETTKLVVIVAAVIRTCDNQTSPSSPDDSGSRIGDCDEDDDDDEIAAGVIVVRSGRLLWCPCDRRRRRRRLVPSRSPGGVAVSLVIAAVSRRCRCPISSSPSSRRLCRWAVRPRCPYSPVTYAACSVVVVLLHRTSCAAKVRRTEDLTGGVLFPAILVALAVSRACLILHHVSENVDERVPTMLFWRWFLFFGGLPDGRCHVKNG